MSYYRFLEILPGALSWLTIVLMFLLSWALPAAVAVFIILFDIYWLLKTIYLSLHLRATFKAMRECAKINWLEELAVGGRRLADGKNGWRDIYHLIILPMYREPYEVVSESFESLLRSNYPKDRFIVVLSKEEAAGDGARAVAEKIEREFGGRFFKFLATAHPVGLSGEIPGKGSNETWAAREAKRLVIDPLIKGSGRGRLIYENFLVSVFDVDTQIFPEYFGRLTHAYLTAPDPLRAIYQPIPLFLNNIYQAPAIARVVSFSATFWQMMQQSRPERLTSFSSQSIPFRVLLDIGFWHTNIVSEDSRVFWQCYLHYDGDFRVEPMLYPVSMDANASPAFWRTLANVYKQQRRWGWGCENIPYLLDGFRRNKKIPARKKVYWSASILEGFHSWATHSLMIFALGWLPVLLGRGGFEYSLLSYSLPQITRLVISLSMVGVATSAVLSMVLLPLPPVWFRMRHKIAYFLQWLLVPVTLIVFGAVPALEAQTRLALGGRFRLGFWVTPKGRYPETEGGAGRKGEAVPPVQEIAQNRGA